MYTSVDITNFSPDRNCVVSSRWNKSLGMNTKPRQKKTVRHPAPPPSLDDDIKACFLPPPPITPLTPPAHPPHQPFQTKQGRTVL
jgi:hypothetical protein